MNRRKFVAQGGSLLAGASAVPAAKSVPTVANSKVPRTFIRRIEADDVTGLYREAGPPRAPVMLLLHGIPTSSFMYRELIPRLADRYRVIAPDLPGFGFTEVPVKRHYKYSFDAMTGTVLAFTDTLKLKRYALYVFDYGAPTGFRLAMPHPERITAIVSQNGNAYEEGLGGAGRQFSGIGGNRRPRIAKRCAASSRPKALLVSFQLCLRTEQEHPATHRA